MERAEHGSAERIKLLSWTQTFADCHLDQDYRWTPEESETPRMSVLDDRPRLWGWRGGEIVFWNQPEDDDSGLVTVRDAQGTEIDAVLRADAKIEVRAAVDVCDICGELAWEPFTVDENYEDGSRTACRVCAERAEDGWAPDPDRGREGAWA